MIRATLNKHEQTVQNGAKKQFKLYTLMNVFHVYMEYRAYFMLIQWHMSQLPCQNRRHETELLAAAIAENLATISGSISVFTEGMPGVLAGYMPGML
jgi:hypothetical protein